MEVINGTSGGGDVDKVVGAEVGEEEVKMGVVFEEVRLRSRSPGGRTW